MKYTLDTGSPGSAYDQIQVTAESDSAAMDAAWELHKHTLAEHITIREKETGRKVGQLAVIRAGE